MPLPLITTLITTDNLKMLRYVFTLSERPSLTTLCEMAIYTPLHPCHICFIFVYIFTVGLLSISPDQNTAL